jgi:hypothetical protein
MQSMPVKHPAAKHCRPQAPACPSGPAPAARRCRPQHQARPRGPAPAAKRCRPQHQARPSGPAPRSGPGVPHPGPAQGSRTQARPRGPAPRPGPGVPHPQPSAAGPNTRPGPAGPHPPQQPQVLLAHRQAGVPQLGLELRVQHPGQQEQRAAGGQLLGSCRGGRQGAAVGGFQGHQGLTEAFQGLQQPGTGVVVWGATSWSQPDMRPVSQTCTSQARHAPCEPVTSISPPPKEDPSCMVQPLTVLQPGEAPSPMPPPLRRAPHHSQPHPSRGSPAPHRGCSLAERQVIRVAQVVEAGEH